MLRPQNHEEKHSSIAENLRATFFSSAINPNALLFHELNTDIFELLGSYLTDQEKSQIKLARTSKAAYQAFYSSIKKTLVNVLKELVKQDDTLRVKALLHSNPYLLLRKDMLDPQEIAYEGIQTTPYQDALLDPMAEEMRALILECFPGKAREEKLPQAALQAEELKKPCFDSIREKAAEIMKLTAFAYDAYKNRYQAWRMHHFAASYFQPFCDAWLRIDLIQRKWPVRLRKIFSVFSIDAMNFENLPMDLPEPHLLGIVDHLWSRAPIGRDLGLISVLSEHDLESEHFQNLLNEMKLSGLPSLILHGEDGVASYYFYGPIIRLDRDESIWQLIPIDPLKDKEVFDLIQSARNDLSIDFTKDRLAYSCSYEKIYRFGVSQGMHLGSGGSHAFAVYNDLMIDEPTAGQYVAKPLTLDIANRFNLFFLQDLASNSAGIQKLYQMRYERLQLLFAELGTYLTHQSLALKRKQME